MSLKLRSQRPHKRHLAILLLTMMLIVLGIAAAFPPAEDKVTTVTLPQAIEHIRSGDVTHAVVRDGSGVAVLHLEASVKTVEAPTDKQLEKAAKKKGGASPARVAPIDAKVHVTYPYAYTEKLTSRLLAADVPVATTSPSKPSWLANLATTMLPLLLLIGLLVFLFRGSLGIGKGGAKRTTKAADVPTTRFSDVAGCDEALEELSELVDFLRDPAPFQKVGAQAPRGALLIGPPGTGKTLLARAVAGEAQVPFFALAGSDFVETYVGVGARRVRDLFSAARKAGGAIVFIDEIDAVGKARGGSAAPSGGDNERENTLISLLNEMDGFDDRDRIIVLAATNRADVLDAALTRPGRLDRKIAVPAPDRRGRERILTVHSAGKPLASDVDLTSLARRTPGMAGADLAQLVNQACLEAARDKSTLVSNDHFSAALETVALGRARTSALVSDRDRNITAWHEAGHTVAALVEMHADNPVSVSIIPRGGAGGVTWMSGNDDVYLTRSKAAAQLVVAMAGRAGEEILLDGDYTQGAHGDLVTATNLATNMVARYGMAQRFSVVSEQRLSVGGPAVHDLTRSVEDLLVEAYIAATRVLKKNGALVRAVAEALLAEETLNAADLAELVAEHPLVDDV